MKFIEETGLAQKLALLNYEITSYINGLLPFPHINSSNYFYLLRLLDHPEITQRDFSFVLKLNQSSITRAINALMNHGYIEKIPSSDKRSALLRLTTLGEETALGIKERIDQLNETLQVSEAIPMLDAIQANMNRLANSEDK